VELIWYVAVSIFVDDKVTEDTWRFRAYKYARDLCYNVPCRDLGVIRGTILT